MRPFIFAFFVAFLYFISFTLSQVIYPPGTVPNLNVPSNLNNNLINPNLGVPTTPVLPNGDRTGLLYPSNPQTYPFNPQTYPSTGTIPRAGTNFNNAGGAGVPLPYGNTDRSSSSTDTLYYRNNVTGKQYYSNQATSRFTGSSQLLVVFTIVVSLGLAFIL